VSASGGPVRLGRARLPNVDDLPQRGAEDTKGDERHSHILKNVRMSDEEIEGCSRTRERLDGGRTSQPCPPKEGSSAERGLAQATHGSLD